MGGVVMLLPLLSETVTTGVSDNTRQYFRAPYVKNESMQPFKQNLPRLPATQQDCFGDWRATALLLRQLW